MRLGKIYGTMHGVGALIVMALVQEVSALQAAPRGSDVAETICDTKFHAKDAACVERVLGNDYDCARLCKDPRSGVSECSALDSKLCHSSCLSRRLFDNSAVVDAHDAFWKAALEDTATRFNWTASVLANLTVPNRTEAFEGFWDSLCRSKSSAACLPTNSSLPPQNLLLQAAQQRIGKPQSANVGIVKAFRSWLQEARLPLLLSLLAKCEQTPH
mmetsp:Transcript_43097/g.99249  ORF Transcript_43097/g.99249 Transcript_43097/m.99249 type:complete len:215 (+) Transcript_43097:74-718(+)